MDNRKYIGMDVHQASISIAVSDAAGKVLMECIIETKATTFFRSRRKTVRGGTPSPTYTSHVNFAIGRQSCGAAP
jgi:hypothetical protein